MRTPLEIRQSQRDARSPDGRVVVEALADVCERLDGIAASLRGHTSSAPVDPTPDFRVGDRVSVETPEGVSLGTIRGVAPIYDLKFDDGSMGDGFFASDLRAISRTPPDGSEG